MHSEQDRVDNGGGFVLINPWNLGDAILTTPLLQALSQLSGRQVDCVVNPCVGDLLSHNPYARQVLHYDFFSWRSNPGQLRKLLQSARTVIVTRMHMRVVVPLLGFVRRQDIIGLTNMGELDSTMGRIRVASFLVGQCIINSNEDLHEAERLWLLAQGPDKGRVLPGLPYAPEVGVTPIPLPPVPYLVVHPGANVLWKCWPLEKLAEVVRLLSTRFASVIVAGANGDREQCEKLCNLVAGSINACGRYSLSELAALTKHCALYIGNDTGSTHLAAATGCPIVAIESDEQQTKRWGPYRPGDPTAAAIWHNYSPSSPPPSWQQRIADVTIPEVLDACEKVMERAGL